MTSHKFEILLILSPCHTPLLYALCTCVAQWLTKDIKNDNVEGMALQASGKNIIELS